MIERGVYLNALKVALVNKLILIAWTALRAMAENG
jgi:hypothetical protein